MSYAGCIAAALAQQTGATVLTGDPEFQQVEALIGIEWLPGASCSIPVNVTSEGHRKMPG